MRCERRMSWVAAIFLIGDAAEFSPETSNNPLLNRKSRAQTLNQYKTGI